MAIKGNFMMAVGAAIVGAGTYTCYDTQAVVDSFNGNAQNNNVTLDSQKSKEHEFKNNAIVGAFGGSILLAGGFLMRLRDKPESDHDDLKTPSI